LEKTFLQKSYEKVEMLKLSTDNLALMFANELVWDGADGFDLGNQKCVLVIKTDEQVIPIANMLSKEAIEGMQPNFEKTDKLWKLLEQLPTETRTTLDEFNENTENDELFKEIANEIDDMEDK